MFKAEKYYSDFNALFQGKISQGKLQEWGIAETNQKAYTARDRFMAEEMKKILAGEENKLVFVGGILHALEDRLGNSLWSRLKKYSPTRATIGDEKYR